MPGQIIFIDMPQKKGCWNLIDSMGMVCVHCGCCNPDPIKRYQSRIAVLERRLQEREQFSDWAIDPETRSIQKRNIACDIKSYKRKIRNYKTRLRNAQQAPGSPQETEKQEDKHEHPGRN